MTKLFVANCSAQSFAFSYRIIGTGQLLTQHIPAGGQLEIYRDTDRATLENIVEQHAQYGLIPVANIDRTKPFISLCYQFDKPITQNHIKYGIEHNTDVLVEVGRERRDQSAVAIGSNLERAAEQAAGNPQLHSMSLEIQEEKPIGDNSSGINEVIQVDRTHGKAPGGKRQAGRAGARA
jgi:hypothetical protein